MEGVWYFSYSPDGQHRQYLDNDQFRVYDSPQEVKEALEHHAKQFNRHNVTYAIVRETHMMEHDEQGNFVRSSDTVELVEHYTAGRSNA